VVSYYEIGTALTANHAHTAMIGVYGMLAIGLLLFCLRYLTHPDQWSDRAAKLSFWSLNIGLIWMAFVNLFPLGIIQLYTAIEKGYWHARSVDFLLSPWINGLEWSRLPGDIVFIVGGRCRLSGCAGARCAIRIGAAVSPRPNSHATFSRTRQIRGRRDEQVLRVAPYPHCPNVGRGWPPNLNPKLAIVGKTEASPGR